ncbi:MAG: DUF6600 domain-containing protein [Hyphomicrobium sp.]
MYFLRVPFIAALLLLAGPALLGPAPAIAGRADLVDVSIFYEDLNEGGDWFEHPRHGYVWSPDVDRSWRPYSRGRWIYTSEYGWFWDSDEAFGWAVYHYGRWGFDEADGWYWVPGRRWGPAWVAWRYGDEYAGWAPLPPGAVWSAELGIVYNNDFHVSVRYDPFWIFVRPRYITYYNPYRFARPRNRYRSIFRYTRPAAGLVYVDGRIFFRGIGPRQYRRIARRSLPRTRVNFYHDSRPYKRRASSKRGSVHVFRPGKKRRYRATRLNAPRVVHKGSPRRAAWKRRGKRPGTYKAGSAKRKPWPELRDGRRQGATITGDGKLKSKSKSGWRRKNGKAKQDLSKTPPASNAKAALPAKAKAKRANDAKRNRMAKRKATSKRKAKTTAKSAGAKRNKRAIKANKKPKGKGNRKQKGENADDT